MTDPTAYVLDVAARLIAAGVPIDPDAFDLDLEQCNLRVAYPDGSEAWLRWTDEDGWHTDDDHGHRTAPICAADTPPAEAAAMIARHF